MSGDPLSDLDCAARIHVFGNARRAEAQRIEERSGGRQVLPLR